MACMKAPLPWLETQVGHDVAVASPGRARGRSHAELPEHPANRVARRRPGWQRAGACGGIERGKNGVPSIQKGRRVLAGLDELHRVHHELPAATVTQIGVATAQRLVEAKQ